jgi:hypothetical protein
MPSSGGSVSDAPVNKVVDGKSHYLAYITPDEGPQLGGSSTVEQAEQFRDEGDNKENIIENINQNLKKGLITIDDALKIGKTYNLVKNSSFINMLSTAGGAAIALAGTLGKDVQKKAMTWGINSRLKNIQKKSDFHPGIYGSKIADLNKDLEDIEAGTFTQTDYTEKYGSGDVGDDTGRQGEDVRDLTNIITPYAAHAVGGTTQQPSMATQWYASLGSGPSNPGAFNLTQQYAAAKTAVSQRLGTSTSVGQLAVNNSPFYNWLKDNSLNKGIL